MNSRLVTDVLCEILQSLIPGDCYHASSLEGLADLYHCALVSRSWCRLAVPILWERPFNSSITSNSQVVVTLLSYLTHEEMEEVGPAMQPFPVTRPHATPLFNYPSFISCLNYGEMLSTLIGCENLALVARALLTVMQRHVSRLHCIVTQASRPLVNEMYLPIGDPFFSDLISPIRGFSFHHQFPVKEIIPVISRECKDLHCISAQLDYIHMQNDVEGVVNPLCALIRSQNQLCELRVTDIGAFVPSLMKAIESQVESLRQLELYYANFAGCPRWTTLASCKNMEVLKFVACLNATEEMVAPLIAVKFPRLQKVYLKSMFDNAAFDLVKAWARKFGTLVE